MSNENIENENVDSVDTNEVIEVIEEVIENKDVIQAEEEIKPKKNSFLHSLINNFTNAAISLVISIVLVVLIDLILRPMGYYISNKTPFTFAMFFVVIVFFKPIVDTMKNKKDNKENEQ